MKSSWSQVWPQSNLTTVKFGRGQVVSLLPLPPPLPEPLPLTVHLPYLCGCRHTHRAIQQSCMQCKWTFLMNICQISDNLCLGIAGLAIDVLPHLWQLDKERVENKLRLFGVIWCLLRYCFVSARSYSMVSGLFMVSVPRVCHICWRVPMGTKTADLHATIK